MKQFSGRVAVITGAASGLGFGLAKRLAEEGMNLVLADIEEQSLEKAAKILSKHETEIITVVTDVSSIDAMQNLAKQVVNRFGEVNLLFNNAGVGIPPAMSWEYSLKDWQWILGVNLYGVIYGLNTFIPIMLKMKAGSECHIINTASASGLLSHSLMAPYNVTKHSVVTLSETVYNELQILQSSTKNNVNIGISVLCPGLVRTNIISSERNKPKLYKNSDEFESERAIRYQKALKRIEKGVTQKGIPVTEVINQVIDAIRENKFYILTHSWIPDKVKIRMKNIIETENPTEP